MLIANYEIRLIRTGLGLLPPSLPGLRGLLLLLLLSGIVVIPKMLEGAAIVVARVRGGRVVLLLVHIRTD